MKRTENIKNVITMLITVSKAHSTLLFVRLQNHSVTVKVSDLFPNRLHVVSYSTASFLRGRPKNLIITVIVTQSHNYYTLTMLKV